jgi:hypothetical protein
MTLSNRPRSSALASPAKGRADRQRQKPPAGGAGGLHTPSYGAATSGATPAV